MGWQKFGMKLTIRPLTPDLWPALEDLFGKRGASNGCWCMYWRAGAPVLEAYPIDTDQPKSTSNLYTGTASTFARAGFRTVARRAPHRPIMRHDLKRPAP